MNGISTPQDEKTWNRNHQWDEELLLLKSIIEKTELVETTKWGGIVYTLHNKNVLGIGGFKSYFTIWFWNGVFLKDEFKVLVNANEGVTKGLRQWRFTSASEVNEKQVLAYVKEAIENERLGKSIKPEKKVVETCPLFKDELDKDKEFAAAFEKFAPYKQKEFLEYVGSAKQEKTQIDRLAKIKPMVLENRGLNDKYRK